MSISHNDLTNSKTMSKPSIQDVINMAKQYLELGLSQEQAIQRAIEEVRYLLLSSN